MKRWLPVLLLILLAISGRAGTVAGEADAARDARMAWWRDAKFGMFIHWGLYAVPAGEWNGKQVEFAGEWIMDRAKIPVADYEKLAPQFNPTKFNADEWVSMAKSAGVQYIVITAKHHEGFAMFHTKVDGFNIYDATPFKRDPLQELAEACRKHGVRLGFYYSQNQDWHHPGGAAVSGHWDKAQDGSYDKYFSEVAVPQVKELLTDYGPISVFWFDTSGEMTTARLASVVDLLKLQPGIIVNDRLGGGFYGDIRTPEQTIPKESPGRDWETCMTINNTWGYRKADTYFKSTTTLLRDLIEIMSKGGNFLLNVGPTAEGVIPAGEVQRLQQMGAWLKVNGEAIYGTTGSPFKKLNWGRATRKPGKVFLHIFDWPADGKLVVPMTNAVTKAYLLAAPSETLTAAPSPDGVVISVPKTAPDAIASVVVLEFEGELNTVPVRLPELNEKEPLTLKAEQADLKGDGDLLLEGEKEQNLGRWVNLHDYPEWQVNVTKAGKYKVAITYSVTPSWKGSEYVVEVGDASVKGTIQPTDDWSVYRTDEIGEIEVTATGPQKIHLRALTKPGGAVMNFRRLVLTSVTP